ncbi:MAG TPA: Uma2 family endonuclease [Isosphaeraceae bacterium]
MSATVRTTYDEFDAMIRRGDFADTEDRFELLFGEIVVLPLPDPPHESVVDELNEWSFLSLPVGAARVRVQSTLGLPALDSVTLPDIAWMRRRDYSQQRPLGEDVLLVIEVADTTLYKDRGTKAKLYAQARIADYWIVNIPKRCLEIRRDLEGDVYQAVMVLQPGEEARPLAFPEIALPVSRLFPA